jgi:hydrogenase maturation protein HypF
VEERRRVRVRGTVQGVGFRPFVYRRALELGLSGWVGNDGNGVLLEVEGTSRSVDALVSALRGEAPPLADVTDIEQEGVEPRGDAGFAIARSRSGDVVDVPVSADVAPCERCLADLADPADRRYRYPFVNCTDCGPRYTIVRAVPYDRPATTMAAFSMCAACRAEYDDPADRRFHAQPLACPACGPRLRWSGAGETSQGPAALDAAVACLRAGGLVAVKGVGGYHLACDATDQAAVALLRERKRRNAKPFAVQVADLASADRLCHLSPAARAALSSSRRPIVLAPRRPDAPVAIDVAPGLDELGILLPPSPLHVLLSSELGRPLVMTSGNVSDEPVAHVDAEAVARLGGLVDGLLQHDREIHVRVDDSVVRSAPGGRLQMVRRARGWTPQPLRLPLAADAPLLAVGAQLKSTVCLVRGGSAVLSQHLGDLDDWPTYEAFTSAIEHLTRLSGVVPVAVAHDLHPDYRSTAWAQECGLPLVPVQHHHAHVAACLVEHAVSSPVLGIAFDGLGLGPDGTLWGGEFLVADLGGYRRVGHLSTAPLPGGDAAVREPWRTAIGWLHRSLGDGAAARWGSTVDDRWSAVLSVAASGRAPETSSVGRLFDTVAAILGLRTRVSYEGQAAVELESLARRADLAHVPPLDLEVDRSRIDPAPMLQALLDGHARGVPVAVLAAGFHLGLARAAARLADTLAGDEDLDTVALTGGVFQNVLLSDLLAAELGEAGLRVLVHEQLTPSDGAVSVGQAAVAAARGSESA